MIKRIIPIAIFTGAGQLLSIFALKYLSIHGQPEQLKAIGETDSLVQFTLNVIALGLQSAMMRNLALQTEWKDEYEKAQSARMAMGVLLACLAGLFFINIYYTIFLVAPLLAWSGDYALYALGYPVVGSMVALSRVFIPYALIILTTMFAPGLVVPVYILGVIGSYLLTNLYISHFLKTPWYFLPRFKSLVLYLHSLPLGIVTLSQYFVGLGLMLIVPYFYKDSTIALTFVGLKFYMIYKGILRIMHQAFLKDMIKDAMRLKVDQLSTLAGILFAGSALIFPKTFINLFFGSKYNDHPAFFYLMAIAAFIYSVFLSQGTKALLEKKDRPYMVVSVSAAVVTIICSILLSYWQPLPQSISVSLCFGETLFMLGLIRIAAQPSEIRDRLVFLAQTLPLLLVPLAIRYFLQDSMVPYFAGFVIFGLLLVGLNLKKFRSFTTI